MNDELRLEDVTVTVDGEVVPGTLEETEEPQDEEPEGDGDDTPDPNPPRRVVL